MPRDAKHAPGAKKGYVLVVEDDNDIRNTVTEALVDDGYEVVQTTNGVFALQVLDREFMMSQAMGGPPRAPDCVLLDLMMPEMDGWEFYRFFRGRKHFAQIPVIIMSADHRIRGFTEWVVSTNGLDVPPVKGLPKPFALEELLRKVGEAVQHHRASHRVPPQHGGP